MSDPSKYTRGYDFKLTDKGSELNNELDNASTAIDEIVAALADVRRSDGALPNGIVTADSLAPGLGDVLVGGIVSAAAASANAAATSANTASNEASDAAASAAAANAAALTADVHKDTFAAAVAATDIVAGQVIAIEAGANGEREYADVVAAGTYASPDGVLVRDATGISAQIVSKRREFTNLDEMLADPRGYSAITAGEMFGVPSKGFRYEVKALGTALGGQTGYHLSTAGGVLLRVLPGDDGVYNFASINPTSASTVDSDTYDKFMMILDCGITGTGYYQSSAPIYIPNGNYYFSQGIELKRSVRIFGNSSGMPSSSTAYLVFPTDTTGITVNRYNTINGGKEITPTTAADGTIIEGIKIGSTVGSDKTKHGIWLRARAVIKNVQIGGFSGNGLNIVASAGGADNVEGNANNWYAETMRITGCGGNGMFIDGADVNAGTAIGIDCSSNGRCGIYDSSFLGNTHIGHHVATNGVATAGNNSSTQSSFVSYGGNRYAAHWTATEADLVATQPGTNSAVWVLSGTGGTHPTIPLWTAGSAVGTYFPAFGYQCDNTNARNVFVGCYSEGGSAGAVFIGPSLVIGGILSAGVLTGDYLRAGSSGGYQLNQLFTGTGDFSASIGGGSSAFSFSNANEPSIDYWALQYDASANGFVMRNRNTSTRSAFWLMGENSTKRDKFKLLMDNFILGYTNPRYVLRGTSTFPTTGDYVKGDLALDGSPNAAGKVGWVCTTSGTAGSTAVFKAFGAIDA